MLCSEVEYLELFETSLMSARSGKKLCFPQVTVLRF